MAKGILCPVLNTGTILYYKAPNLYGFLFFEFIPTLCTKGHNMKPVELRLTHFLLIEAVPLKICHDLSFI